MASRARHVFTVSQRAFRFASAWARPLRSEGDAPFHCRHLLWSGVAAGAAGLLKGAGTSCSEPLPEDASIVQAFMSTLEIVPYGVLGTRLTQSKSVDQLGPMPDSMTVIVDSGGHQVPPPGSPKRAGGSAKVIYKWIDIGDEATFPPDVTAAVRSRGDAKYHHYGRGRHIIHAFGPDLRQMPDSWNHAVSILATTYCNILREFVESGLPNLRLLPVSGGIFAGTYQQRMPELTMTALKRGFAQLPAETQVAVMGKRVDICIFLEVELADFEMALQKSG